jgi:signal peptidase I
MSASVTESIIVPRPSADKKRHVIAALLSALAPGVGQLLLGQKRKGYLLLLIFVAILASYWPLRLPRAFAGLILPMLLWLGLCFYTSCAALIERRTPDGPGISKWWLPAPLLLVCVCLKLLLTPILSLAGFRVCAFSSSSMEPTLLQHEYFLADATYYRHRPVQRDDLVLMQGADYQTVKRVIAEGGDTIQGKDQAVVLNGHVLDEPFIEHSLGNNSSPKLDTFGPVNVTTGKFFVMGDNRDVSYDSRTQAFGLLDGRAIVGRPLYIYRSRVKHRAGKDLH